jgi:hypothetical protein
MKMTAAITFVACQSDLAILTGNIGLNRTAIVPNNHVKGTRFREYKLLAM